MMSIRISEGVILRLGTLLLLLGSCGGGISTLILSSYPADHYPAAKFVCLLLAIISMLSAAWQAQNGKTLLKKAEPQPRGGGGIGAGRGHEPGR